MDELSAVDVFDMGIRSEKCEIYLTEVMDEACTWRNAFALPTTHNVGLSRI